MVEPSLEMVQTMLQRVLDLLRLHTTRFDDVDARLTRVELGLAAIRCENVSDAEEVARIQACFDRVNHRIDRIESRLGLTES